MPTLLVNYFKFNLMLLALDLLQKLMTFDAKKRLTVEEALAHPYLQALHFPDDEVLQCLFISDFYQPTRDPVPEAEFEFEKYSLSLEQLKGNSGLTLLLNCQILFMKKSCYIISKISVMNISGELKKARV